ncbi:hypothetical protein NST28_23270 [Paenibacillus sp. FSL R10-2791]|uniref:hypothetical protein n=1 Tax=Paenibacillus TaxID=44249 RepID=UPI00096DAF3D|nr:hypothetical protein [Paenibacillus odorifer]OME51805.1 hypothetical protein BSK59_19995 [Paenibacillus odorifer]
MKQYSNSNINELLLRHFESGSDAAGYLRGRIPGLTSLLSNFFASRSDIERIQKAEHLSELILSLTDFSDMIPLRSEVATLEITRMIAYKKQTDHTAHTLYLFLLGVWMYDNITKIRNEIDNKIASSKPIKLFLFQWIFASLLHDVGYLFYDLASGNNSDSWEIFDQMFSFEYLNQFTKELSEQGKLELEQTWKVFIHTYGFEEYSNKQSAYELIVALDQIPWLTELLPGKVSGLDALEFGETIGLGLQEFAYRMAKEGYDGKTPVVDHGIASGLMLLKYTSIWYWISNYSKLNYPNLHEELNLKFHYYDKIFTKHVLSACKAAAYHNMHNVQFSLENEPLLYLAVLCDELQIWDRFMSGSEHISNWKTVDHCVAEKIEAEIINDELNRPMLHIKTVTIHYEKLLGSLNKRVIDWEKYIKVVEK